MSYRIINEKWHKKDKVLSIIDAATKWLMDTDHVQLELIERHLKLGEDNCVKRKNNKSMNYVMKRVVESIANRGMMNNVIFGSRNEADTVLKNFGDVLFNFDPKRIYNKYDGKIDELVDLLIKTRRINPEKRNLWRQFSKGIISGSNFLSSFSDYSEFTKLIETRFLKDRFLTPLLPLWIKQEIDGFGYALAADFIKELGYTEFGKPDVHIRKLFNKLGIINDPISDYKLSIAIMEMAEIASSSAYRIDKLFWLIGSGKYYLQSEPTNNDIKRGPDRRIAFIESIWEES